MVFVADRETVSDDVGSFGCGFGGGFFSVGRVDGLVVGAVYDFAVEG